MVDKIKAIELRKQGLSYKKIAEELGCSVHWCKKYLCDVQKDEQKYELIEKCIKQSLTNEGITSSEILNIMLTPEDKQLSSTELKKVKQNKLNSVKTKIKEHNGVVRPAWMVPELADESLQEVLRIVNDLDVRLYEAVLEYKHRFGIQYNVENSLLMTIMRLSQFGSIANGAVSVVSACESYSKSVLELERRNKRFKGKMNPEVIPTNLAVFDDIEDQIY